MPRAEHHGQFGELLSAGKLTVREFGLEEGTQLHLSKAPFVGQEIEAQRVEAMGPRSHSGTGAQQGIKSVWSRS